MRFFVFYLIFLTAPAFAQPTLTLEEAVAYGLENTYSTAIARRNLDIAANNNDWGIAGRYPTVALTVGNNNGFVNQQNPAGSFALSQSILNNNIQPGIEAAWTVFDGYRVRYTKEQLERQEALQLNNVELNAQQVVQQVVLAYYNALIQREQLGVLEDVLALSRDRIDYQEIRREFGQAVTFDVLQVNDAYLNDSTSYLIQLNTLNTAKRNLLLAMGVDDLTLSYTLTTPLDYESPDYQLEQLLRALTANNVQVQGAQLQRELARTQTQLAEAAKYPTLNLVAGSSYNYAVSNGSLDLANGETVEIDNGVGKTFNTFVGFNARYNLYTGGVRDIQIENAQVQEIIADLNLKDLQRTLTNQVANTLATYRNQQQLLTLTGARIDNARLNLDIAEERFRGGQINSFDYRNIQLSFLNANQARLNALFNLRNTETELLRLTGELVR